MLNQDPLPVEQTLPIAEHTGLIRFEEKRESYIWATPDQVLFVKSADHFVMALIQCNDQKKWAIRHSTLKEMHAILHYSQFIRLNRFYLLNRNHFLYINEKDKLLYLDDDFCIPVPHRISPFVLALLGKQNT